MEVIREPERKPIARRYGPGENRDANVQLIGTYESGEMRKYEGSRELRKEGVRKRRGAGESRGRRIRDLDDPGGEHLCVLVRRRALRGEGDEMRVE